MSDSGDWVKRLAAIGAALVTLYSVFNAMVSPLIQRIEDLESEVIKRRQSFVDLREHFHEHELEFNGRVAVLETTGEQ